MTDELAETAESVRKTLRVEVAPPATDGKKLWILFDGVPSPADAKIVIESVTGLHSVSGNMEQRWLGVELTSVDTLSLVLAKLRDAGYSTELPASTIMDRARKVPSRQAGIA